MDGDRGRELWAVYRAWRNLPVTALALGWARWHGARISMGPDLFVECAGMPRGTYGRGGTTIGNAWLYGELGGPERRRHEQRHGNQYALLGTTAFLSLYGLNALLTRNRPQHNVFERWAGLADGGYEVAGPDHVAPGPRTTAGGPGSGSP
ncbi:MAG: hypothetical protein ACRYF3_17525 [Janthinobacterium lividum]